MRLVATHLVTLPAALALALAAAACGDDLESAGAPDAGDGTGDGDASSDLPFDVPERQWTWFPVEGNRCINGSGTGIGLNLDYSSRELVIFLEGGGACFNGLSCSDVAHADGFGEAELAAFAAGGGSSGILDRDDPANPVAGWSYVFIPYCTGDIHAGDTEDGVGGRIQVGYRNVTNAVTLVAERFAGRLDRVLLTGQSAGGFGAGYNYDQVAEIFGDVPVDLIDDSGPPLSNTYLTPCFQEQLRQVWNLEATLPEDCADCIDEQGGGFVNMLPFLAAKYPERRFGLVTSTEDLTIRQFIGFGYPSCDNPSVPMAADAFAAGIAELRDDILGPIENASMFVLEGDGHVWTDQPLGEVLSGDQSLAAWVESILQ